MPLDLHAVGADAREHAFLDDDFAFGPLEQAAAAVGVFAFSVLTDDEEIDVARLAVRQRGRHARHQANRSQIDVLIKFATEFEQRTPQRFVIRHRGGPTDRTEEYRFVLADLRLPVVRHHLAVRGVVVAAPVEMIPLEINAEARRNGIQHFQAFRHDLFANPVSWNYRNLVFLSHHVSLVFL
ncbi:hypothetical protein G6F57_020485 [Rhizopus arrhizus]|nr:hypothetical protein G6F57_020485 [Rhizopus arrhizus]